MELLTLDDVRHSIAQARVDYGATIFENHRISIEELLIIPKRNKISLEKQVARLFPKIQPEGFDVKTEVMKDLIYFEESKDRSDDWQRTKFPYRKHTKIIEGIEIDGEFLAYCGALPKEWVIEDSKEVFGTYSIERFAKLTGINLFVLKAGVNKKNGTFFGHNLRLSPKGYVISQHLVKDVLKDAQGKVLLSEIADYYTKVLGVEISNDEVMSVISQTNGTTPNENPLESHNFQICEVFSYKAIHLSELNILANILRRKGKFSDDRTSAQEVRKVLSKSGVTSHHTFVYDYLEAEGLIQERIARQQKGIKRVWIPSIVQDFREKKRFSHDYLTYCRGKGVQPEDNFANFENDYETFMRSKRILTTVNKTLDLNLDGNRFCDVDIGKENVKSFRTRLREKNKTRIEKLIEEYGGDIQDLVSDESLYVPLIANLPGRPNQNHHIVKKLKELEISRVFGHHEYIEICDLIEVFANLQKYHEVRENTLSRQDVVLRTGISKSNLTLLFRRNVCNPIKLTFPYSDKKDYDLRFSEQDVDKLISYKDRTKIN